MNQNDSNKSFYNWAFTICKFQIMGYLTISSRNKVVFTESYEGLDCQFFDENCPIFKLLSKEKKSVINKSASILSNTEKKVFLLCLKGFRPTQVMKKLNISRSLFSVSKSRALQKVKAYYSNKSIKNYKL